MSGRVLDMEGHCGAHSLDKWVGVVLDGDETLIDEGGVGVWVWGLGLGLGLGLGFGFGFGFGVWARARVWVWGLG